MTAAAPAPDPSAPTAAATRVDVADLAPGRAYRLLVDAVVPRPVAWTSTLDLDGRRNLAPFSFFQAVGSTPPTVIVSCGRHEDGLRKDTAANAIATGELVINIASDDLVERLVSTSGNHPPDVDEWGIAGVTPAPCTQCKAMYAYPSMNSTPVSKTCA